MRLWRVSEVMTTDVAAVREEATFRAIANVLVMYQVSAVPVVDSTDRVVGVVSEADLLHKVEFAGEAPQRHLFEGRRQRAARTKSTGDIARDLMTCPAITVRANTSIIEAAKIMYGEQVKRLPVTDELGRLIGIVSRGDLLRVHLRPDEDIGREVAEDVLAKMLWLDSGRVRVSVRDGVVTLTGRLDRRTETELAGRLAGTVAGIVDVLNQLTYDIDDTVPARSGTRRPVRFNHARGEGPPAHGVDPSGTASGAPGGRDLTA